MDFLVFPGWEQVLYNCWPNPYKKLSLSQVCYQYGLICHRTELHRKACWMPKMWLSQACLQSHRLMLNSVTCLYAVMNTITGLLNTHYGLLHACLLSIYRYIKFHNPVTCQLTF